jgi:leucyl aminopeptidase
MKITFHSKIQNYPEVVVFPIAQDGRQLESIEKLAKRFRFSADLVKNDFKANLKECLPIYLNGKQRKIFLLGIGEKAEFADFLIAARSFTHNQKGKIPAVIGVDFSFLNIKVAPSQIEAFINGVLLGRYNINLHKTEIKEAPEFANGKAELMVFSSIAPNKLVELSESANIIANAQLHIFDLVNAPANYKTPQILADWASAMGEESGFVTTTIVGREALEKINMHALLAVNKGSAKPPAFIIMEYKPEGHNLPTIGIVGKGVTFDTGGISIKPSTNMHNMKSDMGGAAAVLGTMEAVAKLKLPIHLIGIVPSTENCVDGASTKPSEVFSSYSGKTIEMIDTDAEGRLILADGLSYMVKNYQTDIMIDLATLTGSIIASLGYAAAGLFTNNDELANDLAKVGQGCGEKVWRMPLWDNFKDDMNSDIADIKNLSGKPVAGAITAAKFLEFFTEKHSAWAHLDIAGMAFSDSEFSTMRSSTAYGIRLLVEFIKSKIR